MFNDQIKIKAILIALTSYLIITIIASSILVQIWMKPGMSPEELALAAETDSFIAFWSMLIGLSASIICAVIVTALSGSHGLKNAMVYGSILVAFGVLSILLHPDHDMLRNIGKLVLPVPVAMFGGWLLIKIKHPRVVAQS
jgi:MFS family permease